MIMTYKQAESFRFEQTAANTTWTITHNLNSNAPVIDVWVDVSGDMTKILPLTVTATSVNVITLTFSTAYAGIAKLVA